MRKPVLLLAIIILTLCGFTSAQQAATEPPGSSADEPQFQQPRNREPNDAIQKLEKERAKRLNKERHDRIKQDTDKLLALATELKQYVDKSNENILSLDVIRKAEEIEKLAHQVHEKMKAEQ